MLFRSAVSWSVAVEAAGRAAPEPDEVPADTGRATPTGTRRIYAGDSNGESTAWRDVPVYERTALRPGEWLAGPALVVEDETTTQVIAGFELRTSRQGALVLTDTIAAAASHAGAAESAVAA